MGGAASDLAGGRFFVIEKGHGGNNSAVVHVYRTAPAQAVADGPDAGLRALDAIADDDGRLDRFHLAHATRAELLARSARRASC